ncbi:LytR/AlgR family response regulator transcription factor [Thalassotalea fusca]
MESKTLTAYILDDEAMAISKLSHQLSQINNIDIVGNSQEPLSAIHEVNKINPDVIFLDINMSELNGFDVLSSLPTHTLVVFTTAYSEYAIKAFDKDAVDYLLKPFDTERLKQAVEKVHQKLSTSQKTPITNTTHEPHLVSKQGDRIFILKTDDIYYLKSTASGVCAYTFDRAYPVNYSLEQLEDLLDPALFIRLHRSYMINIHHIKEIQRWFGGKLMLIMNDENKSELNSSRDGAKKIKQFFCF